MCFQTEVTVIDDVDAYQTWPGWLMLILRTAIMVITKDAKITKQKKNIVKNLMFFIDRRGFYSA
jgi:hypothetical protein